MLLVRVLRQRDQEPDIRIHLLYVSRRCPPKKPRMEYDEPRAARREAGGAVPCNDPWLHAQLGRSFDAPSWMARTSGLSGRGLGVTFFGFLTSFVRLSLDAMIKLLSWYLAGVPGVLHYSI